MKMEYQDSTEINNILRRVDLFVDENTSIGEIPLYLNSNELAMLYLFLKGFYIEIQNTPGNYPTLDEMGYLLKRIESSCPDVIQLNKII